MSSGGGLLFAKRLLSLFDFHTLLVPGDKKMIKLQNLFYLAVIFSIASSSVLWADARVLHLSPDTPPVDVYVGTSNNPSATETALLEDFPYLAASPYVPLPTNTYFIDVTPAGTSVVAIDVNDLAVDGATDYSIAAVGTLTAETPDDIPLEALVLVDDRTVDPVNGRVRIAHTSPNAPAVDIVVSQLGTEPVVSNLAYKSDTGYLTLPPDTYDVTFSRPVRIMKS